MEFLGKAVSINCTADLGVFQGTIRSANPESLTIVRAFRNGLPFSSLDTEITINATDIVSLQLIASTELADLAGELNNGGGQRQQPTQIHHPVPQRQRPQVIHPPSQPHRSHNHNGLANNGPEMVALMMNNTRNNGAGAAGGPRVEQRPRNANAAFRVPSPADRLGATGQPRRQTGGQQQGSTSHQKHAFHPNNQPPQAGTSIAKSFGNLIPKQVEAMLLTIPSTSTSHSHVWSPLKPAQRTAPAAAEPAHQPSSMSQQRTATNRKTVAYARNQAFGQLADDPLQLDEEFDFEKNLALFDKAAIWTEIDSIQQPEMMRQTAMVKPKNYRHDENILPSLPASSSLRQITAGGDSASPAVLEFCTDDGLVIPTVPLAQRAAVQLAAQAGGLSWQRQCDMLARGTAEMALQLLGGARRLTPQNQHQWPAIVVVCDGACTEPQAEAGLATARQLASHGLQVCVLGSGWQGGSAASAELQLFEACGANVRHTNVVKELPSCDLVILSIKAPLKSGVARWVLESRSITLAIDPPVVDNKRSSITAPLGVAIKHSVFPVLPVTGMTAHHAGKVYLCNLGIPERFYVNAGIQYRSPFGHKFVIPIHPLTAAERGAAAKGAACSL